MTIQVWATKTHVKYRSRVGERIETKTPKTRKRTT